MRQRPPLSPAQTRSFAMGRVILLMQEWSVVSPELLELERGALLDFALQHPRLVAPLLPNVKTLLVAHGLDATGLAELFANRHFADARAVFTGAVSGLSARGLLRQALESTGAGGVGIRLTSAGEDVAVKLCSPLSLALRPLAHEISRAWRRRRIDALRGDLRGAIPDESVAVASLSVPFGDWMTGNGETA